MVEIDEFDLLVADPPRTRGPGGVRRGVLQTAWVWASVAVSLVLLALVTAPRGLPAAAIGVLQGDPSQPPAQVWAVQLPAALADDVLLREGDPWFTGSLRVTSGEPRVVVGTGGIGVVGLDATTGELLWEHLISGLQCRVAAAVACVHATGKWRATISVIDAHTGARHTFSLPGAMQAVPVGTGLAVLGADGAGRWLAMLDADGVERWRESAPDGSEGGWLLTAGGRIYLGGRMPAVLEATTGALVARPAQVLQGPEASVEVVDASGEARLVLPDGEEVPLTGPAAVADAWRLGADVRLPGTQATVALVSIDGRTTAVDPDTSRVLWAAPGLLTAANVVDGDLVAVIGGAVVRWGWRAVGATG